MIVLFLFINYYFDVVLNKNNSYKKKIRRKYEKIEMRMKDASHRVALHCIAQYRKMEHLDLITVNRAPAV